MFPLVPIAKLVASITSPVAFPFLAYLVGEFAACLVVSYQDFHPISSSHPHNTLTQIQPLPHLPPLCLPLHLPLSPCTYIETVSVCTERACLLAHHSLVLVQCFRVCRTVQQQQVVLRLLGPIDP